MIGFNRYEDIEKCEQGFHMYKVDRKSKSITSIEETSLDDLKLGERSDLQQWILKNPEFLSKHFDSDFKVISEELDAFDVKDRLDLLAIDENGSLIVIELKRNDSGSRVDIQGLKYASYCSTLKPAQIIEIYKKHTKKLGLQIDPVEDLLSFMGLGEGNEEGLSKLNSSQVKIVLASQNFDQRVKSIVAYLSHLEVDINCIEFKVFQDVSSDTLYIDSRKIIPVDDLDDFYIKGTDSDTKKAKASNIVPQPDEVLKYFERLKRYMQEEYSLYARGMDHVKYRTFKAGKSGLEFSFEIMKKNKEYKINLISKKPELNLANTFKQYKDNLKLNKNFEYEAVFAEDGKSDWERVQIFVKPKFYLEDPEEMGDLMKEFIESMTPLCEKIVA